MQLSVALSPSLLITIFPSSTATIKIKREGEQRELVLVFITGRRALAPFRQHLILYSVLSKGPFTIPSLLIISFWGPAQGTKCSLPYGWKADRLNWLGLTADTYASPNALIITFFFFKWEKCQREITKTGNPDKKECFHYFEMKVIKNAGKKKQQCVSKWAGHSNNLLLLPRV